MTKHTEALRRYVGQPVVAFDYETTGLNYLKDRIIGFSFATSDAASYFWMDEMHEDDLAIFKQILADPGTTKLCWNAKFEMHFSQEAGYAMNNVEDVMIMSVLCDENVSHKLKDQAAQHIDPNAADSKEKLDAALLEEKFSVTNFEIWKLALIPKWRPLIAEYGRLDSWYTYKLYEYYKDEVAHRYKDLYETETKLVPVVMAMEREGILLDVEYLKAQDVKLTNEADALEGELKNFIANEADAAYVAANPLDELDLESNPQIGEMLVTGFHIDLPRTKPTKRNPDGNPKTDEYTLEKISDKWPMSEKFIHYRELRKAASTYCRGLVEKAQNGRLYGEFWQNGARTGRFSSSNPNLQNISKGVGEIRKAFLVDPKTTWYSFDFDQMELRIMAHYSDDPALIEAARNGEDLHVAVAKRTFKIETVTQDQRDDGKTINFGIGYGMGAPAFSRKLGVSYDRAREIISWYFSAFPRVRWLMDECKRVIYQRGYVFNLFGRRRRHDKEDARKAFNSLIQGCGADMLKKKMVEVNEYLKGKKSKLILQVHDDLVFSIFDGEEYIVPYIKQIMENWEGVFKVPMTVSVKKSTTNWASLEKFKCENPTSQENSSAA